MGALAGRRGRHRSRLAGAAVLTLTLALAAPAAPAGAKTLVHWTAGGGIAGGLGSELTVHRDRSARAVANGDAGSAADFKLMRREWTRLRKRLKAANFRTLRAEYKAPMPVPDGTYESVRYRGHTVTVSTGGVPPGRLERLLTTLYRIYKHHAG
jgi:phosphoserine phosphatase